MSESPSPFYLTEQEVIELHEAAIARFGGLAGIRDRGALDSCLAQPRTFVFGEERFPTLHEKAAAYCFFIVVTHPFHDGNKRTGVLAAIDFLLRNGVPPTFDEDEMYEAVMRIARGEATLEELTRGIRQGGEAKP